MKPPPDRWYTASRLGGLRRFAAAITVFNILGHTVFGFEQSWAQPFVALATGYACELLLEWLDARAHGRPRRYLGGAVSLFNFLLPAHITSLAVAMLLYANDRFGPLVFAVTCAIASKYLIRVRLNGMTRHVFNPSNLGITATLLFFPWVGIAPPYHFTENLSGAGDWILPGIIVLSGTFLNARFTRRLPLIAGWLGGFAVQAIARSTIFGTPIIAALLPMTGTAFILYTFYMITDPPTTPTAPARQVLFGVATAAVYSCLMMLHIVFGLFFALSIVCAVRGIALFVRSWALRPAVEEYVNAAPITAPAPALTMARETES